MIPGALNIHTVSNFEEYKLQKKMILKVMQRHLDNTKTNNSFKNDQNRYYTMFFMFKEMEGEPFLEPSGIKHCDTSIKEEKEIVEQYNSAEIQTQIRNTLVNFGCNPYLDNSKKLLLILNKHIEILAKQQSQWGKPSILEKWVETESATEKDKKLTSLIDDLKVQRQKVKSVFNTSPMPQINLSEIAQTCIKSLQEAQPTLNHPRFSIMKFLKSLANFFKKQPVFEEDISLDKSDKSIVRVLPAGRVFVLPSMAEAQVVSASLAGSENPPAPPSVLEATPVRSNTKSVSVTARLLPENPVQAMPRGSVFFDSKTDKESKTTTEPGKTNLGFFSPKSAKLVQAFQEELQDNFEDMLETACVAGA